MERMIVTVIRDGKSDLIYKFEDTQLITQSDNQFYVVMEKNGTMRYFPKARTIIKTSIIPKENEKI